MNQNNQRGLVSILAVTFTSILISIVTVSVISEMTNDLSQSTTSENQIAAQYAAESGAADAMAYLEAGINSGYFPNAASGVNVLNGLLTQDCSDTDAIRTLTTGSGVDPDISCREVVTSGSAALGTLQENATDQYDLSGATVLDGGSLEIDWDSNLGEIPPAGGRTFVTQNNIGGGGGGSGWNGPPALELTVASNNGSANPQTKSIYLLPQCCDGLASPPAHGTPVDFNFIYQNNANRLVIEPQNVECHATTISTDYDCKAYLPGVLANGLPSVNGTTQYVLRIKALGSSGQYKLTMRNCGDPNAGTCAVVPMALTNATIDVTAQINGSYQRVVETPPIRSNPTGSSSYALLGTDSICKTLQVFNEGGGNYVPQFYADCPFDDNATP